MQRYFPESFVNPLIRLTCAAVLCVILALGLWPFHAPRNQVAWIHDRNGVRFGEYATVMSSGAFPVSAAPQETPCSLEIWLKPAHAIEGGTFLTFYAPPSPLLSLHQSVTDLLIQRGTSRTGKIYVDDLFRQSQPAFVTITSGRQGIAAYIDGALARKAPHIQLHASDCTGRLILGDSVLQQDGWSGEVRGLAVYDSELSVPALVRHYRSWTETGYPEVAPMEHNVGLYLFDERAGMLLHNRARPGGDLSIPSTYTVLDQTLLEPFWEEFSMTGGYWTNFVKNIVGFIPVGLCFYAYFSLVRHRRRSVLITVVIGFAISLTIEVLQAFLPTRDSGMTDLFTNTLGTYTGVLVYKAMRLEARIEAWRGPDFAEAATKLNSTRSPSLTR